MKAYFYPCQSVTDQTVVLSSGLGGHAHFWTPQVQALTQSFHVLCYDQAGIAPDSEALLTNYSIQDMATQLLEILDQHQIQHCHFIGHALGAFIGLELAKLARKRIDRLILINAWDALDPHTDKCFQTRLALLRHAGIEAYVRAQALFLYPPAWISKHAVQLKQQEDAMIESFAPIDNVYRRLDALRHYIPQHTAAQISHRSLVIVNQDDFLVPWHRGVALFQLMKNAELCLMQSGAHASTVTQTTHINEAMIDFLTAL